MKETVLRVLFTFKLLKDFIFEGFEFLVHGPNRTEDFHMMPCLSVPVTSTLALVDHSWCFTADQHLLLMKPCVWDSITDRRLPLTKSPVLRHAPRAPGCPEFGKVVFLPFLGVSELHSDLLFSIRLNVSSVSCFSGLQVLFSELGTATNLQFFL